MKITGRIHAVYDDIRCFSIIIHNRARYFYLQNHLQKKFKKYLRPGVFVTFTCGDPKKRRLTNVISYQVHHFLAVRQFRHHGLRTYYNLTHIREGINDLLENLDYVLFLDLEMTMRDFRSPTHFTPEIIQAGYVLTNNLNQEIMRDRLLIHPTVYTKLNKRTRRFLAVDDDDFEKAVPYQTFYDTFNSMIDTYAPAIIVWGKNDIIALEDSYRLNNVAPINGKAKFINLLQIQKNYFNLKDDLGLFKALELYTEESINQAHDALDDALATKKVFDAFKAITAGNKTFDIQHRRDQQKNESR